MPSDVLIWYVALAANKRPFSLNLCLYNSVLAVPNVLTRLPLLMRVRVVGSISLRNTFAKLFNRLSPTPMRVLLRMTSVCNESICRS